MPPISVLIKPASGNCNMNCQYCFYCDEQENRAVFSYGMMSDETLKNIIRKTVLHAEGYCNIAFQGGEPALCGLNFYRRIVEYEKKYNRRQIPVQYCFQTNGTLINRDWAEFFYQNHFLVGISLDGTEENHNLYRRYKTGENTFQDVFHACRILTHHHVEFNILTVLHRSTAENIREVYHFFKKNGLDYQQYILCLEPLRKKSGGTPYSLTPEAFGKAMTELFHLWYQDWKKGRAPYIRQFENYIGILRGYFPEACDQRGKCSNQYVIEADGGVYPCDFFVLDQYRLGNINTDSFAKIDEMRRSIKFIEESEKIPEKCRECQYEKLCRNGCRRYRISQGEERFLNYFCQGYKQFFSACIEWMKEVADSF